MYKDFFLQVLLLEQYTEQSEQNIKCDIEVGADVKNAGDLNTSMGCTFNRSLRRAAYLKCMSVSLATENVYTDMFIEGLTPGAAHAERRRQIKAEFPETLPEVFADRSRLHGWFCVYYWHRLYLDSTVGTGLV